jgi:hypothetical protein
MNVEKSLVMLVVFVFAFTSINMLVLHGNALTKKEAIEISRNTPVVQEALNDPHTKSDMIIIDADYWNATYIRSLKEELPGVYEELPDDHGVWRVHWGITPPGYQILHFVDELTGEILYEGVYYTG